MKLVVQSNSRIWGGNEKWVLLVATGLAARGHDVLVSCRPNAPVAERARAAGLRITHSRPGGDLDLPRALGFMRMLRRERPDAVLLSAFKRVFWGGFAARRAGVQRIVERLGIEHDLPSAWKYRHAFRHYIDALIVNSEVIRARWLQSAPWYPESEVHVILNGVVRPASTASTLRAELRVADDVPLIASAGRLEARKGFDLLLSAFAQSHARSDAQLLIAGDGRDEAMLRQQAAALGISDRVRWLGFRTDMENVLLGADVFALASRREGMANVLLEAMAAGCLVVAPAISGVAEAIGARAGRPSAGWIVAPEDDAALANGLDAALRALDSPDGAARRAESHYRVTHWFSPDRTIAETERVLAGQPRQDPGG